MNHYEAARLSDSSYESFDLREPNSNFLIAMKEGWKYLTCVGHSLGAVHAQLTGIAGNIPSICFDGPGVLGIAEKLFSQEQILQHKSIMYTSAPNAINTAGKHLVMPIQLKIDTSKHSLTLGEYWSIYTPEQHSIDNFHNAFEPQTGLPKEIIRPTNWPEGLMEGYKAFVKNILQNDRENGYWLARNGLDKEQFAQKYDIDIKRVKHQKPEDNGNEVKKGIQYEHGDSYYILPATTGYNAKNEHQKPSFIDHLLDFASQTSDSGLPNSWIDRITSEATAKIGNPKWDASADVKDTLNQADNILHSNALQNSINDAMKEANKILSGYGDPLRLGGDVNKLNGIFSKFSNYEAVIPCCDPSKHLHSTDCRVCPTNDEL
jgi:hypothetical protein